MEGPVQPETVVVGVDTSTASMHALDWAVGFAQKHRYQVQVLHAFSHDRPDLIFSMGAEPENLFAAGERVLARAQNRIALRDRSVSVIRTHADGYPSAALVRASAHARLVVVGSHGDSLLHISSLGETAHQAAAHAHCPVAVVRAGSEQEFERITVGVDRSATSHLALAAAFEEAERTGAELRVVHAWRPRDAKDPALGTADWASYTAACRAQIEAAVAEQEQEHPNVKVLTEISDGNPTRALVQASHDSDLVCVGTRGSGGFEGLSLGRVAVDVLSHAASSVLLVR